MGRLVVMTGGKYGHLTVVKKSLEVRGERTILWECVCDCGRLCRRITNQLIHGKSTHCGCQTSSKTREKLSLTQDRLKELVQYNEETGLMHRRKNVRGGGHKGVVGWVGKSGHIYANVDGHKYAVHRLVWLYVHGAWPALDIDHIDGDPANNRLQNLRDVNKSWNLQNQRVPTKRNTSGYLGVTAKRGYWAAYIKKNGKSTYLGQYKSPEEASQVYIAAKREFHPGNTL